VQAHFSALAAHQDENRGNDVGNTTLKKISGPAGEKENGTMQKTKDVQK
jgi:hypothetical protein